jgi:2-polyprenyl-3-methyl-5-hydroxy-6-metoxy-1,4-benzoquinol methylase
MPVQPNFLERTAFFSLNVVPGVLLDLAGALAYQAVSMAIQLELFPALEARPLTLEELAQKLNAQERGIAALMQALAAIGYADEKNGRYSNSKMTQRWLLDNEAFDTDSLLAFWNAAMGELWSYAPEVIRNGERPYDFYRWVESTPELAHSFQQTMVMTAQIVGPDIAKKLKLPDAPSRLLDVGGGHGMFSIIMCQHFANLHATVLDSHSSLETARKHIATHNLQDRITLQQADLWAADWGEEYDVVFLFNLLHHFNRETNVKLLQKTANALKPGGTVSILDQIAGKMPGAAANAFIRLIALQYYLFADGRVFTHDDLTDMLTQTGFTGIQFHKLGKAPGTSLMTAVA